MKKVMQKAMLIAFILIPFWNHAQGKLEFGKIDIADLTMSKYEKDSTASAVILADVGRTYWEYSTGLILTFEKHIRIKIFNSAGYEFANGEIPILVDGSTREIIKEFEAATYNYENGQIVKSKLSKEGIFDDKVVDDFQIKKFALPNVREGSIIEYKYKIKSDFWFNTRDWTFQSSIPTKWSEYTFEIPQFFFFNKNYSGYHPLSYSDIFNQNKYIIPGGSQTQVTIYKLGGVDMPAFVPESHLSSPKNFISQISLEVSGYQFPSMLIPVQRGGWTKITEQMLENESFGLQLNKHGLVKKQIDSISALYKDEKQKMIAIYNYAKGKIKWNEYYSRYTKKGVRKAFDEKTGNVAEVNLFLTLMLRDAGFKADPVILSTRENGTVNMLYPSLERYNYVISHVKLGDKTYLLDATDKWRPYNVLPKRVLNGSGRIISKTNGDWVGLKMEETDDTRFQLLLKLEEDGNIAGQIKMVDKSHAAYVLRKKIIDGTSDNYITNFKKDKNDWDIKNFSMENLENVDDNLNENFEVTLSNYANKAGDKFYIEPVIFKELKENPFQMLERKYPIDFAFPTKKNYVMELTLPVGYKLAEKPLPSIIALPDNGGRFTYSVSEVGNKLMITSSLSINKTFFLPDEYLIVKEFFDRVSKKMSEQLVITKL